jgi:superfamily II DNA or RNA helicase
MSFFLYVKYACTNLSSQSGIRAMSSNKPARSDALVGTESHWQIVLSNLPLTWLEKGVALTVIRACFQMGGDKIRIASGFFTIRGWNYIRPHTRGCPVALLVGIEDPGEDRARMALIQAIMRDLRTGRDLPRRQAVAELIARIENQQFQLLDARALSHHAKIYMVDEAVAIIGSSNTTGRGLLEQIESGSLVTSSLEVKKLVASFEGYFARARDLTQELLDALRRWLTMATPWDIYLKTMLALEDLQPLKMTYPKQPVSYQTDMIAQTLRQIRSYGGSMLVASTGLGKTVVAIHVALHLKNEDLIDNIIVIGPKAVRSSWKRECRSADLPHEYFVLKVLDMTDERIEALSDFEDIAKAKDNRRWLIIIDESHEFRNRYTNRLSNKQKPENERRAFQRLTSLIRQGNAKVLMLTGSPYATKTENLNNQLNLLPHTGDNQTLLTEPEFADCAWRVGDTDEFIRLPVASQLTTPHVAMYYGVKDERGTYIQYGNEERRYIPKVRLYSLEFPLNLEPEMSSLIAQGYFDLNTKGLFKKNIERLVRIAWTSSPLALKGILQRVLETPGDKNAFDFSKQGKVAFKVSKKRRQAVLEPILAKLDHQIEEADTKLRALVERLSLHNASNEKIIIFCERRATVVYLSNALSKLMPSLSVAATIDEQSDSFDMKESYEIEKLIEAFAPKANAAETGLRSYDVFISTDAHGVGVNMQDAAVVINYDIDWTPIGPIQRAGRILRFWPEPRTVHIYTFVPTLSVNNPLASDLNTIRRRWNQLMDRHEESARIIDLPVLTENQVQDVAMSDSASDVTLLAGDLDIEQLSNLDISPYYQHTAKLQLYRDYALELPSDLVSARAYPEKYPAIYVLLQYSDQYYGFIYTPHDQCIRQPETVKLLDILQCEPMTAIAIIEPNEIEALADECIQVWCDRNQIDPEQILRECTMYLCPEHSQEGLQAIFQKEIAPKIS